MHTVEVPCLLGISLDYSTCEHPKSVLLNMYAVTESVSNIASSVRNKV